MTLPLPLSRPLARLRLVELGRLELPPAPPQAMAAAADAIRTRGQAHRRYSTPRPRPRLRPRPRPPGQGSPPLLRFEFVGQRLPFTTSLDGPVAWRHRPLALYPRFRPMTSSPTRFLSSMHSFALSSPSSRRFLPCHILKWTATTDIQIQYPVCPSFSRQIRTMPDPVPRTASPYTNPSFKGPRSQQLSSGLPRSLLQDYKSMSDPRLALSLRLPGTLLGHVLTTSSDFQHQSKQDGSSPWRCRALEGKG